MLMLLLILLLFCSQVSLDVLPNGFNPLTKSHSTHRKKDISRSGEMHPGSREWDAYRRRESLYFVRLRGSKCNGLDRNENVRAQKRYATRPPRRAKLSKTEAMTVTAAMAYLTKKDHLDPLAISCQWPLPHRQSQAPS
ncbi:hypothetical protein BIW11_12179 [Tropilaelaps mercedesae]|uniref:Secreted protein n=1 Tax=Tropilaelaps mercedesae TaxID=418985 RepID=A0A1V9X864_9ACAR|nr:hypothetical protein BIW11_12179 [Tropilaelaps mercedesae]